MYDYLLVGAGLFNAVLAYELSKCGKKCLVVERRNHIGGNCYTEEIEEIIVHKYGAHIFRTSDKEIWEYMQQFAEFNHFINSPIARYKNEVYNLPFNMNTFSKLWGVKTPDEAKEIIAKQSEDVHRPARNLEEHAIGMTGIDIYEKLIKGYTEKQWGKRCDQLPASIMKRIPLRFTYDNNYYRDRYQGIPIGGFTPIFEKMFYNCDIRLGTDYLSHRGNLESKAAAIIYSGTIDSYYEYKYGALEYRSLYFETEILNTDNFQGVAVVNYTDADVPYTRIIEHKHFEFGQQKKTVISKEYPREWELGTEPYYPINDMENMARYEQYRRIQKKDGKLIFGGRLGSYQYYDMQDTVKAALGLSQKLLKGR
ncbi:MAG: UDP-galactopyranose mutase [Lachnospiraceae bacterium]|nr:UDP-galactopyranose mutase [Lachnospiraceae bacterium]